MARPKNPSVQIESFVPSLTKAELAPIPQVANMALAFGAGAVAPNADILIQLSATLQKLRIAVSNKQAGLGKESLQKFLSQFAKVNNIFASDAEMESLSYTIETVMWNLTPVLKISSGVATLTPAQMLQSIAAIIPPDSPLGKVMNEEIAAQIYPMIVKAKSHIDNLYFVWLASKGTYCMIMAEDDNEAMSQLQAEVKPETTKLLSPKQREQNPTKVS